ncbi:MAG: oxidoreductase [Nostocoides sp.]
MANSPTSSPDAPRVALVTGASSGIGAATARRLGLAGFTVIGAARRRERLEELRDVGIHPLVMDVTDEASLTTGIDFVLAQHGRVDVLVNNAGYGSYGAIEEVPLTEARRQFEVNLFGLARLVQLVTPSMRAQESGRIINITSMGGRVATPFGGWYHATKFALEGFSDSLRQELAPFGIRVVIIEPGAIRTEWGDIAMDSARRASGHGPYALRVQRMRDRFTGAQAQRLAAEPDVVARAIERAATAAHPRTRYAVGGGAKPVVAARRLLPDRVLDTATARLFR